MLGRGEGCGPPKAVANNSPRRNNFTVQASNASAPAFSMRHMPILRLLERSNLGRMILIGSFARTNLVLHVLPLVDRYDPIAEIVAKKGTKLRIALSRISASNSRSTFDARRHNQ
jgi:hypothetical protein